MRIDHFVKLSSVALPLALFACGGGRSPARSTATTTGVVVESGPATPGDPAGTDAEPGVRATSGAVASPMEGACESPEPSRRARDWTSCMKSCQGWNDHVPLGSRCVPARTRCEDKCGARYVRP